MDQECRPLTEVYTATGAWTWTLGWLTIGGNFCLLTFTNNLTQVLSEPVPRGRTSGKFPCVALILMDVDTFSSLGKGCSAGESQLDSVLHKSSLYGARSDFVTRHLSTKEEHLVASFMNF